ncbi:MAG: hypothetical protein Q9227_004625 [Pyrenula ochraceoflavens]
MESPSATSIGQKIDDGTFRIVSILMACIAIVIVSIRLAVRFLKLSTFHLDDYLLFFATITLIGSTVMVNLLLPYNQTEVDVGAGLRPPPPDFVHILDYDVKFQDATVMLGYSTIFGVKYSFLAFFRMLVAKTSRLRRYWWFVVIFTIPCAVICMCTEFMVCPAFGRDIMAVCVYSGLQRQLAVLYVTIALDIVSDLLLISIPVLLLWGVQMNVRRKLGFGWLLCLSVFCIICVIIRAVGHKLVNGQNDVVWILFWTHMEGCVALIACSMTAFRALFQSRGPMGKKLSPRQFRQDKKNPTRIGRPSKESEQTPQLAMPTMTKPTISGLMSIVMWDPFEKTVDDDAERDLAGSVGRTRNGDEMTISSDTTLRVRPILEP